MVDWLREHWRAFLRSGAENHYTFIWWTIDAAIVAAVVSLLAMIGSHLGWLFPELETAFSYLFVAFTASAFLGWIAQVLAKRFGVLNAARVPSALPDTLSMSSSSIEVRMTPGPGNTKDVPFVQFATRGRPVREVKTEGKPEKLRFVVPTEQIVLERDLPVEVPIGKGRLIVKRFTDSGFSFEERNTNGDTVKAEIYYAREQPPLITIQDPRGGPVPHLKIVKGFVQPPNTVQVFVRAGPKNNRLWYRQGNVQMNSGEWIARCVIGDDKSLTGGEYRLCAIAGATRLPDRFKDFPSDVVVKSGVITVILNRDLSDDWIPQVGTKEKLNATAQSDENSLIAALAEHHDRGKFLFTVPVKRNEDFESWELSVLGWRRDVIASLPKIDAVRFDSPVSAIDSSRLHPDALNRRHEQLKNRILADLAMIEKIMERYRSK